MTHTDNTHRVTLITRLRTNNAGNEALSSALIRYFATHSSGCRLTTLERSPPALAGYVLEPGETVNLLVALGTKDPCGGTSQWVAMDYHVGGSRYTASAPMGADMAVGDGSGQASPECVS